MGGYEQIEVLNKQSHAVVFVTQRNGNTDALHSLIEDMERAFKNTEFVRLGGMDDMGDVSSTGIRKGFCEHPVVEEMEEGLVIEEMERGLAVAKKNGLDDESVGYFRAHRDA